MSMLSGFLRLVFVGGSRGLHGVLIYSFSPLKIRTRNSEDCHLKKFLRLPLKELNSLLTDLNASRKRFKGL